jgi:hypothetical protein
MNKDRKAKEALNRRLEKNTRSKTREQGRGNGLENMADRKKEELGKKIE